MANFKEMYYKLFAAVADAVELLEQAQTTAAKNRLISAMQAAEERYLQEEG